MAEAGVLFNDGAGYERLMGRWSRIAGEQFIDWLDAPKGLRWLDVGCGNGAFTEVLIERATPAAVTAIDPSEGQLAYARTRPGTKLAQFRQADAEALPFAHNSFDAVSMALVITFLADPAKAVAEMARVARPGAIVASYMWDIPGGGLPIEPMYVAMKSLGIPRKFPPSANASRRDAFQALWQQAGLQSVETTVIPTPVVYPDFDDFWQSNTLPIGTVGQAISGMSPATRDQLRARLREQLSLRPDGSIAYTAFANAVKGRVPG